MERELRLGTCSSKKRKQKNCNYDHDDDDVVLPSSHSPREDRHKSKKKKRNNNGDVLPDFSLEKCSAAKNKDVEEGSSKKKKKQPRFKKGDVNLSKLVFTQDRDLRLGMCSSKKRKHKDCNYDHDDNDDVVLSSSHSPRQGKHKSKKKKRNNNDDVLPDFSLEKCSTAKKKDVDEGSSKKKKKQPRLKKGDIVNLSELLFTQDRDFLITHKHSNRDCQVQAKHLEGKVVVLNFVPLVPWNDLLKRDVTSLVDIYNALYSKCGFEVVFVGITPDYGWSPTPQQYLRNVLEESFLQERFEEMFSIMPWTAIPFSDVESRNSLEHKLRLRVSPLHEYGTISVVINPTGVVLQTFADLDFLSLGAQAYPFSDERIKCLRYEDEEALNHPSITKLLTFPERNYFINNQNQEVPVHNLENKVVALFFYQDANDTTNFTIKIQTAYEELLAKGKNFEIVLVYVHDSLSTSDEFATEESFWKTFSKMPWLALPFKDPRCKSLKRIFSYPVELDGPDPRLVIIGPQGKYYERYGADILLKFGIKAYPFTRVRVAKSRAKYTKTLKLDMFWDPNTCFARKNGPKVKLSQFVGKRIILIIESDWGSAAPKFWRRLKARYLKLKDTNDAFEVIYISKKQGSSYGKHVVATMSWLRHPPLRSRSNVAKLLSRLFIEDVGLVAFDRDGTVVRKSTPPSIERGNMDFPFYGGGIEKEALIQVTDMNRWDYVSTELW